MVKNISSFKEENCKKTNSAPVTNYIRKYIEEQERAKDQKGKESLGHLVNERVKFHAQQKKELGGRVQVCRILIQKYYTIKRLEYGSEDDYIKSCEAVLDNVLVRYNYDIELIIDKWREVQPKLKHYPDTCGTCGYRPPFCGYLWESECSHIGTKEKNGNTKIPT